MKKKILIIIIILGIAIVSLLTFQKKRVNDNNIEENTEIERKNENYIITENGDSTYTIYDEEGNPVRTVDEEQEEGMKGIYQDNPNFNPNPMVN